MNELPSPTGIELSELARHFAGVQAVAGVSLRVGPGEIVGLIGPNGSGKSTLLNLVSGVLRPTSGSVRLDGREIGGWSAARVTHAGVSRTFQNIRLFGTMTVLENVMVALAYGAGRQRGARRRQAAREALERLGLGTVGDRLASELSYGLQRRVEIARCVASGARYVLLDEPAAGMNDTESEELLGTLRGIHADYGVGMVVIDHDLRLIMDLCPHLVVLSEGRVIASGPPEQVRNDPAVITAYLGSARSGEPLANGA